MSKRDFEGERIVIVFICLGCLVFAVAAALAALAHWL